MKILVVGGTGNVGSQVVLGLLGRGHEVRVMTRDAAKAGAVPKGATGVVGDLQDPKSLRPGFGGVDAVFLVTAMGRDETAQGLAAAEAAKSAGVKRFVYMAIHHLEDGAHIPMFAAKIPIVNAVRGSGMAYTFIQPNNFHQSDLMFKDAIVKYGVYPVPIGSVGISRVDVRDIADAVVNALSNPGHEGATYPVVGPDTLTGPQIAAVWGRHLGREVKYGGDDVNAWAAQARSMLPEWLVHDVCILYEHFQKQGLVASAEDYAQQAKVLGHAPRSFDSFVAEVAPGWRS